MRSFAANNSHAVIHCPFIKQPAPDGFQTALKRLSRRFQVYAATSPQPLPAPGLLITPEIRQQSELYLPISEIRQLFYRLYQYVLSHPPIFGNTPFHTCPSWADCFVALPVWLQFSANPARLLERLLDDQQLLTRFLFSSFLPGRFNGAGFGRYPGQLSWLQQHLAQKNGSLRILDAACGSGEGTWEVAELLAEQCWQPEQVQLEGWTIEPLEVWAAQTQCLPHDPQREKNYQQRVQPLREQGWGERISFRAVDLLAGQVESAPFDLILCNGLLGGPIIHQPRPLQQVVMQLAALLAEGGVLLVADHFHEGWKKRVPEAVLGALMEKADLQARQAGGGLAAIRN
ncbi:class I SAM-dependent methyltransferase [Trichlorobacter lovleyi]|uniref:class I SAM-dependent methyltransferase n=1 Tax=Trichlorobacter lovleyi TaxID=313985 RepID=UPI000674B64E|nr:methyltransferase domain-containing protein [Trichlorobacter lovleyi]